MKGNLGGNGNDLQKSGITNQQDIGNPMFSSNLFRQQPFFECELKLYHCLNLTSLLNVILLIYSE